MGVVDLSEAVLVVAFLVVPARSPTSQFAILRVGAVDSLVAGSDWRRDRPESPAQVGTEAVLRAEEAVEDGDAPARALEDLALVVRLAVVDPTRAQERQDAR